MNSATVLPKRGVVPPKDQESFSLAQGGLETVVPSGSLGRALMGIWGLYPRS